MSAHPSCGTPACCGDCIEFQAWPKIPRLFRDMIITEKIDGTNAAVIVSGDAYLDYCHGLGAGEVTPDGVGVVVNIAENETGWDPVVVAAQSRKRVIAPGKSTDNFGFAGWVRDNAQVLAQELSVGYHYGEWWGLGIQRGYGQERKRFSLFNVSRYASWSSVLADIGVDVVPVLYEGPFMTSQVWTEVGKLRRDGSVAAPGQRAEGVVVFHSAAGQVFKVTCENDDVPKERIFDAQN